MSTVSGTQDMGAQDAWQKWVAVTLLTLLFATSFVDRFILSLLADPLSRDLGLGDGQLGLLMGAGFSILYSFAGLPLAHLIDTYQRKRLLLAGVALWSLTTIASGFANGFASLLVCRAGVAVGEAVLTPAAVSLIADYFIREKRATPMAVYSSVGAIMGTGSFVVGALALEFAGTISESMAMAPWRLTMVLVGLPGLFLAFLFLLLVREPERRVSEDRDADKASLVDFFAYLRRNWAFYVPFILSGGLLTIFGLGMPAWMPTILVREHGFDPSQAGFAFGFRTAPAGLIGIFFWPWLAMRIERFRRNAGPPVALLIAACAALIVFPFAPRIDDTSMLLIWMTAAVMISGAWAVLPVLGFQIFSPSRFRGRLAAMNLLSMNLLGFGVGPNLIVYLGRLGTEPGTDSVLSLGLSRAGLIVAPLLLVTMIVCVLQSRQLADIDD
ncbi:MFS transporter [Henriciella aquimarina]|uniref:MFS transporter n=1 Tax=Henriciella aquimarina TaxID=545261 RepID=UPI000A079A08|nr:MFS transporter [Henriciella aquimarina]